MKLDRNVNPDGKGKYALLNHRTGQMQYGNEAPGEQFFVMKYKDRFTAAGLRGYAKAIREYITLSTFGGGELPYLAELDEYATEIEREAEQAAKCAEKLPD